MIGKQNLGSEISIQQYRITRIPYSPKPHFMSQLMVKTKTLSNDRYKCIDKIQQSKGQKLKQGQEIKYQEKYFDKNIEFVAIGSEQELEKKVKYIHGNKIQGTWKSGILHGHIKIQYETGEYFEGIYINGARKQGFVRFKDKTQYTGGFQKDIFNGHGTLKDPTGRVITCEWEEGQPKGTAQIQYPTGDIYVGEVKKLKKHGQGHLFFKNGTKYVGNFMNGTITGQGCYYEKDKIVGKGIWKNGVLEIQQGIKDILSRTLQNMRNNNLEFQSDPQKLCKRKVKNPIVV